MRLMAEAGRRSARLFNEVCLSGNKIEKPVNGVAYFEKIELDNRSQEPISERAFCDDYSFSAIDAEKVFLSKKGVVKRKYAIPDLCRRKVNVKEICNFRRWS